MQKRRRYTTNPLTAAFTIVEVLVIAPIVILAIGAFITVIVSLTGEVLSSRGANTLTYNLQDALNRIEQDVRASTTYLATNTITLNGADQQGVNGDGTAFTNVGGASGTSLILSMIATTENPMSGNAAPIYVANQPHACDSDSVAGNTLLTVNVVYFVKDGSLWRRTILPSNYESVACATPWQQPSCTPGYTSSFCKTNDVRLVNGVENDNFLLAYFAADNLSTPNTVASNTGQSNSVRAAALQGLSTVDITIEASQTIAGRTITNTATTKASRPDTNAGIAPLPSATVAPSTPALYARTLQNAPATVIFDWQSASGTAPLYTFRYRVVGIDSSWITSFSSQPTKQISIAVPHGYTIEAEVTASNSAGSSTATTSYAVPLWAPLYLPNGYSDYGDGLLSPPSFTKTASGIVIVRGTVSNSASGNVSASIPIATLPEGYRPDYTLNFATVGSGAAQIRMLVSPNGDILPSSGSNATIMGLDGIAFIAASSPYSWTTLATINSWTQVSGADEGPFSYATDSMGRIHIRGRLSPGTGTNGTVISNIPTNLQTSRNLILPVRSGSGGENAVTLGTTYATRGVSAGTAWLPYHLYIPDANSVTWSDMTMQNSWVEYSSVHAAPQYTKTSDGIVTIRGLVKSGTTSGTVTVSTLPEGYRPSSSQRFSAICNSNVPCQVRVNPAGTVQLHGGSSSYSSLSGVNFLAEQ